MTVGCTQVVGFVLLVLTMLAAIVAFLTPFWLEYRFGISSDIVGSVAVKYNRGLWAKCTSDDCTWAFEGVFESEEKSNTITVSKINFNTGISIGNSKLEVSYRHGKESFQSDTDWFKATQALMSLGLGLGLIALLMATLTLCCTCHKCNPNQPICGLLVVAGIVIGIAVTIFGVKANSEWSIELQWEMLTVGKFGWSFWVAVSSSIMSLLTSSIYGCIGRSQ